MSEYEIINPGEFRAFGIMAMQMDTAALLTADQAPNHLAAFVMLNWRKPGCKAYRARRRPGALPAHLRVPLPLNACCSRTSSELATVHLPLWSVAGPFPEPIWRFNRNLDPGHSISPPWH
jgi:hypothetical protein